MMDFKQQHLDYMRNSLLYKLKFNPYNIWDWTINKDLEELEVGERDLECFMLQHELVKEKTPDLVNHPPHYQTAGGLETIDVIAAFTAGLEGLEAVCSANVIKYICRWKKKNGLQDLEKAQWYLSKLIDTVKTT